jgi:soluble lytic murein transglycosylase-like protein
MHESGGGKTHAYRYEPGFWLRYMAKNPKWDGANPERVSASYGLMQVMFPTALEHGYPDDPPEYLFVPTIGIEYGCRVLAGLLKWSHWDLNSALAAYNGGKAGNPPGGPLRNQVYVDKVLAWLRKARAGQID